MQCAFCKDELLEGATACRACGRRQPLPPAEREKRLILALVAAFCVVVFGGAGYSVWADYEREAEIGRIVAGAKLCGKTEMTRAVIEAEIDEMHNTGVDWWTAAESVNNEVCPLP